MTKDHRKKHKCHQSTAAKMKFHENIAGKAQVLTKY